MELHHPIHPKCIKWFKVYCAILVLCYFFTIGVSYFLFRADPIDLYADPLFNMIFGVMMVLVSFTLLLACILPFFLKPQPWVWVYDLVIICLGLTSICFWPFSIPLLIFWLKPETKNYFGRI